MRKEEAKMKHNTVCKSNLVKKCKREIENRGFLKEYLYRIPAGCAACGGPYPDCCDSCPMFDD